MNKSTLLFLLIFWFYDIPAQTDTQNLKSNWANLKLADSTRIQAANDLAWEYYKNWEFDSAMHYANTTIKLGTHLQSLKWQYKGIEIKSNVHLSKSQFEMAHKGFEKCLQIGEQLSNDQLITKAYKNIGDVFFEQGNYPEAHKFYLKGLTIAEKSQIPSDISLCLYAIGKIYSKEDEPETAKNYFLKSLTIDLALKKQTSIGSNYNGLGLAYENLGNLDSAIWYYHKSLEIDYSENNLFGIATALNNIGILYDNQENYEKALTFYHKSLRVEKEINDYVGMMGSLCNIGMVHHNLEHYQKAIDYNTQALLINEKANYNDFLLNVYYSLYESNKSLGNYKESLEMLELFTILDDSLFSIDARRSLIEQETKYQIEKDEIIRSQKQKELERQIEIQKSRRNNLQYYAITLGLFVLFGLLFFASKFQIPKWLIEFASFLAILILFEFLLVLLDTYIEQWSGGVPSYKLLINVGLAALIFPIHSFFEGLFKKRLFKL
jgi:tetratricopeptide (TPR) repeat protein